MPLHPTEVAEARRFGVAEDGIALFVERERAARERVARLRDFYALYPCRTGVLHRLATAAIALARFAALSEAYTAIGEAFVPIGQDGEPRSERWAAYVEAHELGRPRDIREERWLEAHLEDMEAVKEAGWVERFEAERSQHADDPVWNMLEEHMAVTLGTRVDDREALDGRVALETAIATSLGGVVRRQVQTGMRLVRLYALSSVWAVLGGGPQVPEGLPRDRELVGILVSCTAQVVGLGRVWRLGHLRRARGVLHPGAEWSLLPSLDQVLELDRHKLHQDVQDLFDRMDSWDMTARVDLSDLRSLRFGARWATLLVGQGMYEQHLEDVPARFRLFQREDGSLHFVREFWCADAVRVFDSDFVVRRVDGRPVLVEVFRDLALGACMNTEVMPNGGLSMTIDRLFVRGIAQRVGPVRVCFTTEPAGDGTIDVQGVLELKPRNRLEQLWLRSVMRLPDRLGSIRYKAVRREAAASN